VLARRSKLVLALGYTTVSGRIGGSVARLWGGGVGGTSVFLRLKLLVGLFFRRLAGYLLFSLGDGVSAGFLMRRLPGNSATVLCSLPASSADVSTLVDRGPRGVLVIGLESVINDGASL
jgi:hypothetical protein